MADWTDLDEWWLDEIHDPAYAEQVLPLALRTLSPEAGSTYLDLGCGEGRVMKAVAEIATAIGVDVNLRLLVHAAPHGPVVAATLPQLNTFRVDSVDGAYVVLALEHIHDAETLFSSCATVVRPGGTLAVVLNHPVYTAPGSGPVLDPTDDEIYWRFGGYFERGSTQEPAGDATVEFVHRSMADLLTMAARQGWMLEHMEEEGVGEGAASRDPLLAKHGDIPHLLAVRWRLPPHDATGGMVT